MDDYELFKNKIIALIVWNTEKENDVHVYLGEITENGGDFKFSNASENWNMTFEADMIKTIKEVTPGMKEILLNADFALSLSLATLTEEKRDGAIATGMKWRV